jgi:MOSC domain-containing protein YiiM
MTLFPMHLRQIYVSPGHNFFGHYGRPPGEHPLVEVTEVECVAGSGLRGDRFFDYKTDYKGQVTFFAYEVWLELCAQFQILPETSSPGLFRRNLIIEGVDLNTLIGREFELQGVRFAGTTECSPCHWMDSAFHPGTEAALRGRGGLRARILTNGRLHAKALVNDHA